MRRSSLEAYVGAIRRLTDDYEAYLKPLSHDELLLKIVSNIAIRTAPESGQFASIRLRLVRAADDGSYSSWPELLTDLESAVQLASQYTAKQAKIEKFDKGHERDSAKSAINKCPPKGKGRAQGTKASSGQKPWETIGRAIRDALGLPENFDRTKAKPGDFGTCLAHTRWEPHAASACRSNPKPARAKSSRMATDEPGPAPAAKAARTTKLAEPKAASAIAEFLRAGEPSTGTQRGRGDFALRVQAGALGAGHTFLRDTEVSPSPPFGSRAASQTEPVRVVRTDLECAGASQSRARGHVGTSSRVRAGADGDGRTRSKGELCVGVGASGVDSWLSTLVLPPATLSEQDALTPATVLGFSPTAAPQDFTRKTPAKRITLEEYMNRSAYVSPCAVWSPEAGNTPLRALSKFCRGTERAVMGMCTADPSTSTPE
ncbi:hypothetical protein HK405_014156, partial [Cladochytrium tenue]